MAQITRGVRAVLAIPRVYSFFRWLVLDDARQNAYAEEFLRARPDDRILDIACGPADILEYLPAGVKYEGFDLSKSYIERARRRWGNRGTFHRERVEEASLTAPESYDLVLSLGILHHLDDEEAAALFRLAYRALKPGGRLVTTDPCFVRGQSAVARHIISMDRGRNVRDEQGYVRLARSAFADVEPRVRHDLLRIPYTHLILECTRPSAR